MKEIVANIGGLKLGKGNPVLVQTMTNTDTNNIEATVAQCLAASEAGADLVRLTTQGIREVNSLAQIKAQLREKGCNIPLVADIHFNSDVAIAAAKVAEKVRINPGNFAKDHEVAKSQLKELIKVCKEYSTAVRIGINHGSLGKRITELYGNTPLGMQEAICEWIEMCIEEDFYNIVLSLKASNTVVMIEAYRLLDKWSKKRGLIFPIHLGVTEAGNGDMGRIKSAVGIATLLKDGIGDTIRVSLTENPINEIPVAKLIAQYPYNKEAKLPENNVFSFDIADNEARIVTASCEIGPLLIDNVIKDFEIKNDTDNILKNNILQAARKKFYKCEYIACPGCGRTLYNLENTFNEVKEKTSHLKGIVIAVMGCIVNGPGEMADADYGYIGEGGGKVTIYRKQEVVAKRVPQEEAISLLVEIIENDSKNKYYEEN